MLCASLTRFVIAIHPRQPSPLKPRWDRAVSSRWLERLGGSLALAMLLYPLAPYFFLHPRYQLGPWSLAWVLPVGFVMWVALEWLLGPQLRLLGARINRQEHRRFEVLRAWGIPILVDWSVPALLVAALPAAFFAPAVVISAVLSEALVMLIHEAGHAAAIRRFRGQVVSIEMSAIHGRTNYFSPMRETPPIPVAWAGVIAQLLVAVPASLQLLAADDNGPLSRDVALFILGPWNALNAALNLLPIRGLDGAIAWKALRRSRSLDVDSRGWRQ